MNLGFRLSIDMSPQSVGGGWGLVGTYCHYFNTVVLNTEEDGNYWDSKTTHVHKL